MVINFIVKILIYRSIIFEFFNLIKFTNQNIFIDLIILVIYFSYLSVIYFLVSYFHYSITIIKNFKTLNYFFIILIYYLIIIIIIDFKLIIIFRLFLSYLNHYEDSIDYNLI